MVLKPLCNGCSRVIGHLWQPFKDFCTSGLSESDALSSLGVNCPDCRTALVTHNPQLELQILMSRLIQYTTPELVSHTTPLQPGARRTT